ncbi:MAG: ATP synthase F0 subunit B [Deltaproteobacteria bacterium]|nr:ATP synthase F0 subunit B [Deltaproteobacteria bacterium]MBN2672950.1 ATP synthase F0 subunit B [Deltaproteobacteria bacterium]
MSSSLLCIASGGSLVDLDGTFFIQLGIFFVMFIFLYVALFKPVLRLIDARREATDGATEQANETREKAAKLANDVDAQLVDIRAVAAKERARLVDAARQKERELLASAMDAARTEMEKARAEMARSAETLRSQLHGDIGTLADAVASRMIDKAS